MIRIPLTYQFDARPTSPCITVERYDDGGLVVLYVDLEPTEGVRDSVRAPNESQLEGILSRYLRVGETIDDLYLLAEEIQRLRAAIREEGHSIDRMLTPQEARELAAALIHYATEAEAGR